MSTAETQVREWGGSLGVVIPKELVSQEGLNSGDTVELLLIKKNKLIKEVFGKLKLKRSTEEILKEVDEEGWNA
ncbi:AbrB/MazE/SpoVT family DNA-binding domain-containing protein [Candidatus Woesearchaeota archaeon]|nr:AbrB/MazE/SpoVT family DNA-binding domain-containing protein [Candidatus Woesearchaeota archaeon]